MTNPEAAPPVFDAQAFRKALGSYPTGVTVVTTRDADGTPRGFTANSFTSVSLTPPLILVCIAKTAHSHATFVAAPSFAVNVLADSQRAVSSLFASKQPEKFGQCTWTDGITGSPVIEGSVATFDCRQHQCVDAGDHTILIGEVVDLRQQQSRPLGYCRGAYVGYQNELDVEMAARQHARVAALIETPQGLLLIQDAEGVYRLPSAPRLGQPDDGKGLRSLLKAIGITATLDFVFSVYEDEQGPWVVYRGQGSDLPQRQLGAVCCPLDELDQIKVADDATRTMLNRYARERREDVFGIYVGDAQSGDVASVTLKAA